MISREEIARCGCVTRLSVMFPWLSERHPVTLREADLLFAASTTNTSSPEQVCVKFPSTVIIVPFRIMMPSFMKVPEVLFWKIHVHSFSTREQLTFIWELFKRGGEGAQRSQKETRYAQAKGGRVVGWTRAVCWREEFVGICWVVDG